jgi:glycosyltransferase involved in cell wall biosynthesis
MTVSPSRRTAGRVGSGARLALAVADANWYTTENLFQEVRRENVSTLLLKCMDYCNAWQRGLPPWAWGKSLWERTPALWQRDLVLPSGWMKRFPRLGMRPIGRSIRAWQTREVGDSRLLLVMTYPHYLYLRDQVRPEASVYFNIDDYSQYWPRFAQRVNELEHQAVRESDLTICVSRLRVDELRAAVPDAAERIHHMPHGSPTSSLADRPWDRPARPPGDLSRFPRPLLGYIGTLEDRVDWQLLTRVSGEYPRASIIILGRPWTKWRGHAGEHADYLRCLARPNVHAIGWRPQETLPLYNCAFDVCLIPYRTDHPFNRVCSPTKIMDYMGTGRPIVSTDIPECQLYDHLFHVAASDREFIDAIRTILAARSDDGRAAMRLDWARANTCQKVADRLLDLLPV